MPGKDARWYALSLCCTLPGDLDLPEFGGYPFATEDSDEWYVVVSVTEDEALIEDVRRMDWELPEGIIDRRPGRARVPGGEDT